MSWDDTYNRTKVVTLLRGLEARGNHFRNSSAFFPALCALAMLVLVLLKVSGSSVGFYHLANYGSGTKDTNLIANHPRGVRSDEFLYVTANTVGQSKSDYPLVSSAMGQEENMSVLGDAPYHEWSTVFRPQNLAFLILPLEYAFAFKWWFLAFLLLISCYYFCLALLPNKRLWASLIAIAVYFSPFVQWWYQTMTLACLFYSFLIMLVFMALLEPIISTRKRVFLSTSLAYLLICFALLLYPPFQIPCVLTVIAFCLGYLFETYSTMSRRQLKDIFLNVGSAFFVSILAILFFIKTRADVISTIQNTVYPGKRVVASGGFSPKIFLSNPFLANLQSDTRAAAFYANQSEASNFITMSPFLLLTSTYAAYKIWLKKRSVQWTLLFTNILLLLFLARLFVPHFNFLFKALQLGSVPLGRMLLGLGLIGIVQLVLVLRQSLKTPGKSLGWAAALLAFVCSLGAGFMLRHIYPGYLSSSVQIVAFSLSIGIIAGSIQYGRRAATAGLVLFAVMSCISSANVNPLYRGLGPLTKDKLVQAIQETGTSKDNWAVAGSRLLISMPFAAGKQQITGIYMYPQKRMWTPLGNNAPASVYNRFAHVILSIPPITTGAPATLQLEAEDYFVLQTSTCDAFFQQSHIKYILSTTAYSSSQCIKPVRSITYPTATYYIYEVIR